MASQFRFRKVLVLAFFVLHSLALSQVGNSGLSFLKLGVSARNVSMGDAGSAIVSGASATHYNPAGILTSGSTSTQILLMHKEWIQDVRSEFLGATAMLSDESAIGVSVNTATVSDIQVRTRPGTSEGTFTSRDFSVGLSYARKLSDELTIGITAKYLFEKIYVDEANGIGFDLGAQYKPAIDNLTIGLALANLGTMNEMANEKVKLPSLLRVGPAYSIALENMTSEVHIASDLLYIFPEKKAYVNVGGELLFNKTMAARLGYQLGSNGRGFSAGLGVEYGMFTLDYSFAPLTSNLGSGHTFSVSLSF